MKSNFCYKLILIFLYNFVFLDFVNAQEQFNFNVKTIEILNNGNLYKGLERGTITTKDGVVIEANTFTYNKITNIVDAEGQVKVEDVINNYVILSDTAKYKRNEEKIITEGNSKGIDNKNRTITSNKLTYNKITNIVDAEGQVKVEDVINNYVILSDTAKYKRNEEKIITEGNSKGIDNKNRTITSNKLTYNKITNIVDAEGQVKVEDVINNYVILSDTAKYKRNEEKIITEGNSKGIDNKNRTITSNKLTYNKITNIVDAEGQVKVEDVINNYVILSDTAKYKRNEEKIITEGFTEANLDNKFKIESANITYLLDTKK